MLVYSNAQQYLVVLIFLCQKFATFQGRKLWNHQDFGGLGKFIGFFFWNHHTYLISSKGLPTWNRIPRFSTSLFVL